MPGMFPSLHGVGCCPVCGGDSNEYPCTCPPKRIKRKPEIIDFSSNQWDFESTMIEVGGDMYVVQSLYGGKWYGYRQNPDKSVGPFDTPEEAFGALEVK